MISMLELRANISRLKSTTLQMETYMGSELYRWVLWSEADTEVQHEMKQNSILAPSGRF